MKNMFIVMLILMAITGLSNAATIEGVTVQASAETKDYMNTYTGYLFDGRAVNLVNGSGFDQKTGTHVTDGIVRGHLDLVWNTTTKAVEVNSDALFLGNMWAAPIDPLPSLTFDLGEPQTLTEIKVWNANSAWTQLAKDAEGTFNMDRLGMGVKEMEVVLLAVDANNVLATYGPYTLDRGPGRDDIDFGQVIDIPDTANVNSVKFNILSNYGDAPFNGVGLSEVRFYNDSVEFSIEAGDDQVVSLIPYNAGNPDDPNNLLSSSITLSLDGTVLSGTAASTNWDYWSSNDDPNGFSIGDPNLIDTTVTIGRPGIYTFTLEAGILPGDYESDTFYVRVLGPFDETGLLAHWTFDDDPNTTTATDEINGRDILATDLNDPAPDGAHNWDSTIDWNWSDDAAVGTGALQCTGSGYANNLPNMRSFDDGEESEVQPRYLMSVSMWIKNSREVYYQTLLNGYTWDIGIRGNSVEASVNCPPYIGPTMFWTRARTNVADGQWHFIVMTYDGIHGELNLYVDSRLEGRVPVRTPIVPYILSFASSGSGVDLAGSDPSTYRYAGLIDDVKIYQIALTEDEVRAAYEAHDNDVIEENPCSSLDILFTDINGDCQVDLTDFVQMAGNWLN